MDAPDAPAALSIDFRDFVVAGAAAPLTRAVVLTRAPGGTRLEWWDERAGAGLCGATAHREGDSWLLTLFRRLHGGKCPFAALRRDGGAAGDYLQDRPFGPYNLDPGAPIALTLSPARPHDQEDREDGRAAAATSSTTLRRLALLRPVCEACPEFGGWRTKISARCARARSPCGCRSVLRHDCGRWDEALAADGLLRPEDLTAGTPAAVVSDVVRRHGSATAPRGWTKWPHARQGMLDLAAEAAAASDAASPPAEPSGGRGVLIVAGGAYLAGAYVTLRLLAEMGCRLPAEIWHLPGEDPDAATTAALRDAAPGALRLVDAGARGFPLGGRGKEAGWQLKAFAVAHAGFDEVLYLDGDCYAVRDPTFLFDHPAYRDRGAVFWPDKPSPGLTPQPEAWRAMGLEPRDEPPFESGQFVVDRRRHLPALRMAWWMNLHHRYYHELPGVYGDKDTFHLAFRFTGHDYAMAPGGWEREYESTRPAIVHRDPDGRGPLFVHRVQDKFTLAEGADRFQTSAQLFAANTPNPALPMESAAFDALAELRRRLRPPDMGAAFAGVYRRREWGEGSGPGSTTASTAAYRRVLQELLRRERPARVLDLGCGYHDPYAGVDWCGAAYEGVDVVASVVGHNASEYGCHGASFRAADFAAEEHEADLVILKDVLQHWSLASVRAFLPKLARCRLVLITNTTNRVAANADTHDGGYRPLDVRLPPLSLGCEELAAYRVDRDDFKTVLLWRP